jgi:protein SCO1/2
VSRPLLCLVLTLAAAGGCARKEPPKRYQLHGQVLAIDAARKELTIKHDDIANFMPAMTMNYQVADDGLLRGRTTGEVINGVLEVADTNIRLVEISHAGSAPLPDKPNEAGMAAGVLDAGDPVPDTAFIDQTNKRRSLSEWTGTPYVLTFIYTRCPLPNFCPLMNQNFATIQRRLADDTALRGHVRLITMTFDPQRDTPDVLAAQAASLKADPAIWTFLTGDTATVERFAGRFGVSVIRDPQDATQITHNLRTVVVGGDGRIAKVYTGNEWTPNAVLTDLRGLAHGGKN